MKITPFKNHLADFLAALALPAGFASGQTALPAPSGVNLQNTGNITNGPAVTLPNSTSATPIAPAFSWEGSNLLQGFVLPVSNFTGLTTTGSTVNYEDLLPLKATKLQVMQGAAGAAPSGVSTLIDATGIDTASVITDVLKVKDSSTGTDATITVVNGKLETNGASIDAQTLSLSGNTLSISGGNSVSLPASGGSGTVTSVASGTGLTGGPITSSGTLSLADTTVTAGSYGSASAIPSFTVDAQGRLTAAASVALPDTSATNEIQSLDLSGSTLSLSNGGGSVNLASLNTDAQSLSVTGNLMNISGGTGATVPNLYTSNGTLSGQRTVSQGLYTLYFTGTGGLHLSASNYLQLGSEKATREIHAGQIGYEKFTAGALDIVGAGDYGSLRYVKVWDNLLIDKISTLEFGHRMPGKEARAGQIGYNLAGNALEIVGAGTALGQRGVKVWDNLTVVDACSAASFINTSDRRLKQNIKPTHYGLDAVLKMRVVDYRYKADPKKPHTGFIAQDLHQVYPEAVTVGGENVKTQAWGVDYAKLTPLLTKAVQEQQQQIETLTQDKAAQAAEIAALKKQQAAEITTLQAALEELHQFVGLKTTPRQTGRKATASR